MVNQHNCNQVNCQCYDNGCKCECRKECIEALDSNNKDWLCPFMDGREHQRIVKNETTN